MLLTDNDQFLDRHIASNMSTRCLVFPWRICFRVLYLSRPATTFWRWIWSVRVTCCSTLVAASSFDSICSIGQWGQSKSSKLASRCCLFALKVHKKGTNVIDRKKLQAKENINNVTFFFLWIRGLTFSCWFSRSLFSANVRRSSSGRGTVPFPITISSWPTLCSATGRQTVKSSNACL